MIVDGFSLSGNSVSLKPRAANLAVNSASAWAGQKKRKQEIIIFLMNYKRTAGYSNGKTVVQFLVKCLELEQNSLCEFNAESLHLREWQDMPPAHRSYVWSDYLMIVCRLPFIY